MLQSYAAHQISRETRVVPVQEYYARFFRVNKNPVPVFDERLDQA
jgi:hypothetical protein